MTASHWDDRYAGAAPEELSWFQKEPATSVELITGVAPPTASVVDVGGGESRLVEVLLDRGFRDLTVVDVSQEALNYSFDRVGVTPVTWLQADIREWQPDRTFDVWHDRAAYHFLTEVDEQMQYWSLVRDAVEPGGHVVIATFAQDGPTTCSGLPVVRYGVLDLERAMGEGFTSVLSRRELHPTPSGGQQAFTWLVAERIA